ncbi:ABC transporter ATP-binding protein [Streptomyces sp. NPDC048516]|uniref:ABC transporter ATP-binding protein n=1 Tax=Streptomyces sp. NPDC048516 TaxID=3365565 RepID=UPI00372354DE
MSSDADSKPSSTSSDTETGEKSQPSVPSQSVPQAEELGFRRLGVRTDFANVTTLAMAKRLPRLMRQALALGWRTHKASVTGMIVCDVVAGAMDAFGLLATTNVITSLITAGDMAARLRESAPALVFLMAVVGLRTLARITANWLADRIAPLVAREAEIDLLTAGTKAELVAYDHPGYNERWDAADRGADASRDIVFEARQAISAIMSFLGAAAVITVMHPLLLPLLSLGALPRTVSAIRAARVQYIESRHTMNERRLLSLLRSRIIDKRFADQIRSATMFRFLFGRYRTTSSKVQERWQAAAGHSALINLAGSVISGLSSGVIWGALALLLASGQISVAKAGTVVLAMRTVSTAMSALISAWARLFRTGMYLDDWSSFLEEAGGHQMQRGQKLPPPRPRVFTADDIVFTYPGGQAPAVNGVSLTVGRGEIVALVGENGSGKTTLAKLITGLYLPDKGSITWDETDLADLDPEELWRQVAHVPQEYAQWPLTARENINLGQPREDDAEALQVASKASGADQVMEELRSGPDTLLASQWWGGQELSGGQWQRIALARAFYRQADLLVMDEPTAALDARSEHGVFAGLRDLAQTRGILMITHRLTNVASADRIIVLDHGKIVEQGSYDQLLEADGLFAELHRLQHDR